MGEVVMCSEDLAVKSLEKDCGSEQTKKNDGCSSMWERFLPKMKMRILLVEADDSTRQIIAALLRKCSYRVAAVPDGLKAWEFLKGRPRNVDLILTEVDLPSISGFALLTLIMEHEICKNIPVIMMSSQDSISTVYKCMMRGASDYLVKPLRKNELSNLWQHVWRKSSTANGPQDESVAQQTIEGTSENDAASNHSNANLACPQRNEEQMDKGSDAQSACTKPELEAESVQMENMQELSQSIQRKSFQSDLRTQRDEVHINLGQKSPMHGIEARGSTTGTVKDAEGEITHGKACDGDNDLLNSCRDAIDFIGVSNDHWNCSYRNAFSSNATSKFDSAPNLDLSLMRSNSSGIENQVIEKRHTLGHSNASAFTRYVNRPLQAPNPTSGSVSDQNKEGETSVEYHKSAATGFSFNPDTPGPSPSMQKSIITPATGQSYHSEVATFCPQQRVFPIPIPVKGVRVNNPCAGYGSVLPSLFCSQTGSSPMVSRSSVAQQDSSFLNMFYQTNLEKNKTEQTYVPSQNTNNDTVQSMVNQEQKLDSLEDRGHISPTPDQSASSSFCNGDASHLNNIGYGSACGSNSNVDQVAMVCSASESKNEESCFTYNGYSHRSIQREAALTKFRMKRKDRCFEKKVRYESRKKLAEQRPRIKGQFVRQMQTEVPSAETEGNSQDG
ncbi:hypothetical protein UlMin_045295 [Ulmus minor]